MPRQPVHSISVKERFDLEVQPDIALVKFYVTGEGMTMEDAVANARKKVAETTESLKADHDAVDNITVFDIYFGQKEERLGAESHSFPRHGARATRSPRQ